MAIPLRLALTAAVGLLLIAVLSIVVFTAGIAERFGSFIATGRTEGRLGLEWPDNDHGLRSSGRERDVIRASDR